MKVTVSGPGLDRTVDDPALGLSLAITYANQATRQREETSYYVRNLDGVAVHRADSDGHGGVTVITFEKESQ